MTNQHRPSTLSRYRHEYIPRYRRIDISPHDDTPIHNSNSFHPDHHATRPTFCSIAAACVLAIGLVGCGSSASDPASDLDSRASAIQGPTTEPQAADTASDADASVGEGSVPRASLAPHQPAHIAEQNDGSAPQPALTIPDTIAKGLSSSNPRARYAALDYWDTQGAQAPLDPVFDAMEDEDPAVRAKATAIVEHYWAAEEEREKG